MEAKLGVGIIGTGSIVNTYVKCLGEIAEVYLSALHTKSEERSAKIKEKFGVRVHTDLKAFLEDPGIQLVCVCNESGNHGEAIIAAAKSGKHILCEKPIEVSLDKIDAAIKASKEHGVKLGVVFQNRYNPHYKAVSKVVKEGMLGRLLMGNAHINWYRSPEYYSKNPWRGTLELDGGAAFMNQGIHTIDLLLHIFGAVHSVFGTIGTKVHDIEGEDVGSGILTFTNGAIGNITAGTALYPGYPERLEVYGENGSILMAGGKIVAWNIKDCPAPDFVGEVGIRSGASDPTAIGHLHHKLVILDMIRAIHKDETPMVDGYEGRKSVEVITALYQSSKEEKVVFL